MVKSIKFAVKKAHKSWVLVDEENECVFLFDEPPSNRHLNCVQLSNYVERCIIKDENSDVLAPHNLRFHRLDNHNKKRAIIIVAKVMDRYYNGRWV